MLGARRRERRQKSGLKKIDGKRNVPEPRKKQISLDVVIDLILKGKHLLPMK